MKERLKTHKLWNHNFKKALLATLFLKYIPFIRMIGLNGSMVRGTLRPESDIDFLIISKPERIFTVRFLTLIVLIGLKLKRSDHKSAGQICPNRFATTNQLDITPHNKYHAWTFCNLLPLFSFEKTYEKYQEANRWMKDLGFPVNNNRVIIKDSSLSLLVRSIQEKFWSGSIGDYLEHRLKNLQIKRIKKKLIIDKKEWNIKLSDDELCFHLKVNFTDFDQIILESHERYFN